MADKDKANHPMQPVEWDGQGVVRFKGNAIVRHLLDNNGGKHIDLNDLARMNFTREDWAQFAQLIGYSVSGWGDLSYVPHRDIEAADYAVECLVKEQPEDPQCPRKVRDAG